MHGRCVSVLPRRHSECLQDRNVPASEPRAASSCMPSRIRWLQQQPSARTFPVRAMLSPERDIAGAFLLVYAGLFPVINPLGAAPMFLSLTSDVPGSRDRLALSIAVSSFLLLLGSMLCGSLVLQFFGITIPAVRVAGGALVACMGWHLLNGR